MKSSNLFSAAILSFACMGCGDNNNTTPDEQLSSDQALVISSVRSVSDYEFTMNNQKAVTVYIGPEESKYFDITLYRKNVKSGYSFSSNSKSNNSVSVSAQWDGQQYVQSSKHNTALSFRIVSLDSKNKTALVSLSAKLVNPYEDKYITLSDSEITVTGNDFINLTEI